MREGQRDARGPGRRGARPLHQKGQHRVGGEREEGDADAANLRLITGVDGVTAQVSAEVADALERPGAVEQLEVRHRHVRGHDDPQGEQPEERRELPASHLPRARRTRRAGPLRVAGRGRLLCLWVRLLARARRVL